MGYLLALILIVSTSAELGPVSASEQKKMMDTPTYGEPIYAPGVKTNLILGRQWQQLLFEDFESGMPGSWTVIDNNSDGYFWTTGTTPDLHGDDPPNYGTAYAYYSDDDATGGAPAGNEELQTPSFYITIYDGLSLIYSMGFDQYDPPTGQVWARFFSGGSWGAWNTLVTYSTDTSFVDTLDLSSYLPADSVQVNFVYVDPTAGWGWAFGIDNVDLSAHLGGGGMYDIGVIALNSPPSLMKLDSAYQVISTMRNAGDSAMTFGVHTEITDLTGTTFYFQYDSNNIYLLPDSIIAVSFGNWTMTTPDDYIYQTYVTTPDSFAGNDTMQTTLQAHIDLMTAEIISPVGMVDLNTPIDVIAKFKNIGLSDRTADLHSDIVHNLANIFTKDSSGVFIAAGDSLEVNFGSVTFTATGSYTHTVYVSTPFDVDPSNDTLSESNYAFTTYDTLLSGWTDAPPTIDGSIDPVTEWANAGVYDVSDVLGIDPPANPPGSAILYIMNDSFNLYMAVDYIADATLTGYDQIGPYFDENNDGVWDTDSTEGNFWFFWDGVVDSIIYRSILDYTGTWSTPDADFQRTLVANQQYEVSIPLGDDATNKYYLNNSQLPDTFGFYLYVLDRTPDENGGLWPTQGCTWNDPATYGKLILSGWTVGIGEEEEKPSVYSLSLESPIIHSNGVEIRYTLPKRSDISIGVYDATGRMVYSLERKNVNPGWYKLNMNLDNDIPSGIYFVRMEAGAFKQVRKAIILR
ncbi:T9SS type A sorting domain-containing protein [candidate division WOR-3 bacterium]|nr:T9SS type A sorting domain-containing protein [candidate division WOR-3 bacterium]